MHHRLIRLLALALFLVIGFLTIPKLAPRMKQLFDRRDAKVQIANHALDRDEVPPSQVRMGDIAWIAAAAAGGLLILTPLGYFALRRGKPHDSTP